jgi:hypothetical protein
MDPMIIGASMIALHGFGVIGLWLRLRWRVRHEQVRGGFIIGVARALYGGGEVDERRPDGSWLKLSVTRVEVSRGEHG